MIEVKLCQSVVIQTITESSDKSLPDAEDVTPVFSEPGRFSPISRPPDRFTYDRDHIH